MTELTDPDDRKLVTLARAARSRIGADEGAALRDVDGRSYAAATVDLPSLQVSAIGVAVSMAVASGSTGAEAVVVLTESGAVAETDLDVIREFGGAAVPVHRGDTRGGIAETVST